LLSTDSMSDEISKLGKRSSRFGGVEAGGSKFVCAVGEANGRIVSRCTVPTTTPRETIAQVASFFRSCESDGPLAGVGLAAFGPIDLNPHSPTYGFITSTPKKDWQQCNLLEMVAEMTGVPDVALDTDVNCAVLAEYLWGAGRDCDPLVYITLGTGIGGGTIIHGKVLHGLVHPEMGHLRVPHDALDNFPGCCPAHGDCLEGLASGTAMAERWGIPAHDLPPDHPGWRLETHYVALGLANIIVTLSPKRVVLGGGLRSKLQWSELFQELQQLLNGYVRAPELNERIANYIVESALAGNAGVLGAIAIAAHTTSRAGDTIPPAAITA
jgi:fructokinase